jgi:hypothetical protein
MLRVTLLPLASRAPTYDDSEKRDDERAYSDDEEQPIVLVVAGERVQRRIKPLLDSAMVLSLLERARVLVLQIGDVFFVDLAPVVEKRGDRPIPDALVRVALVRLEVAGVRPRDAARPDELRPIDRARSHLREVHRGGALLGKEVRLVVGVEVDRREAGKKKEGNAHCQIVPGKRPIARVQVRVPVVHEVREVEDVVKLGHRGIAILRIVHPDGLSKHDEKPGSVAQDPEGDLGW